MVFMPQRKRSRLSPTQETDVWTRWKDGQSLHEIGRAYNKPHTSIRHLLLPRGGIPPAARRRSRLSLTLAEREDISRGICSGSPLREIARRLNRAASTPKYLSCICLLLELRILFLRVSVSLWLTVFGPKLHRPLILTFPR